jgi:aspartyl-tRNA(Asn)/glutamyl-tRNA(Gln) amidotransferase subunit A
MEAVLERIEETHEALNALVARREPETLLEEARRAEERLRRGEGRPLEGVPLGVKDLEDVAGMVTSKGSRLFVGERAERDEIHVARLRGAGAIVVGKTNTPEFGFTAITKNLPFGTTRSPWNLERTPGGSSGGSAALLAGCVLPLVTASDGGGSIRIPASFTGAFGLKPTFGRVPRGPIRIWDSTETSVYGPLTKTVEDAALFLDQVVGHDPGDPKSLPHPGLSYLEAVRSGAPPEGLRIAFSPDLGYAVVQSDVAAAVAKGVAVFEELGHTVELLPGGPPQLGELWGRWGNFDLAGQLYALLESRPEDLTFAFRAGLEAARVMPAEVWAELRRQRAAVSRWCAEVFARYDLLVVPTLSFDPPPAKGPFPSETEGRPQVAHAAAGALTIPFNLAWNPAASVRVGLSRAGLPIGMQIVGALHRDDLVLRAARAFEEVRPWHPDWPVRF